MVKASLIWVYQGRACQGAGWDLLWPWAWSGWSLHLKTTELWCSKSAHHKPQHNVTASPLSFLLVWRMTHCEILTNFAIIVPCLSVPSGKDQKKFALVNARCDNISENLLYTPVRYVRYSCYLAVPCMTTQLTQTALRRTLLLNHIQRPDSSWALVDEKWEGTSVQMITAKLQLCSARKISEHLPLDLPWLLNGGILKRGITGSLPHAGKGQFSILMASEGTCVEGNQPVVFICCGWCWGKGKMLMSATRVGRGQEKREATPPGVTEGENTAVC